MKPFLLILAFIIGGVTCALGQKVDLEKWVSHTVDSLRHRKVDTIEYYHVYCGNCEVLKKPNDTSKHHSCVVGNGWVQVSSKIIYEQTGIYYSLTFDCGYPPIKKQLPGCKSLSYFMSIVPVLDDRDKAYKTLRKERGVFFLPPTITDGTYETAILYTKRRKKSIAMQEDEKTSKAWRSFFWIDKQTELLALLKSETSASR